MIRVIATLVAATLAGADLPVDCSYRDALGVWEVREGARVGDHTISCTPSTVVETNHTNRFTLTYPDVATDEIGNVGNWILVYNQGFEVNINERSYWAPFHYTPATNSTNSTFSCDKLSNGYVHDTTLRHWACFTASKVSPAQQQRASSPPEPESAFNLDSQFTNDHDLIQRINQAQSSWVAHAYPDHEKLTHRQWVRRSGGHNHARPVPATPSREELVAVSRLPRNFDWRDYGGLNYVSPVRNQGNCGSCYSFASAAMLESRLRILTNFSRQDILSPQNVLDCSNISEGCDGGFAYLIAGRYAREQGFVSEDCTPYRGEDGTCTTPTTCTRTYVNQYGYVGGYFGASNEQNMMLELVANGPVAIGFNVLPDFKHYKGGIYHHVQELASHFDPFVPTNHEVLIVGYGVDEASGEKFWTVKNSWGKDWGLGGYFMVRRGTDECGVESCPFAASVIP